MGLCDLPLILAGFLFLIQRPMDIGLSFLFWVATRTTFTYTFFFGKKPLRILLPRSPILLISLKRFVHNTNSLKHRKTQKLYLSIWWFCMILTHADDFIPFDDLRIQWEFSMKWFQVSKWFVVLTFGSYQ